MMDMTSLTELQVIRDELLEDLTTIESKIAGHPDTIKKFFPGITHELISRVAMVATDEGWTDSAKNPVAYQGFRFVLDEKEYVCRHGSNWCSDFTTVGPKARWDKANLCCDDWPEDSADPFQTLLDDGWFNYRVIGLALLVLNKIIG